MHPTWALVFILLTIQPHAALSNSTLTFGAAGTDVPIAGHPLLAPRATKGRPPPHASRPPATGDGQLDPPYLRPSVVGRAQPHSARKLHQALGSILSAFQLSLLEHVLQTTPPDDDPERAERVVRSLVRAAAHAPPVPALRLVSSLGLLRALDEALHDEARRRRFELLPVLWVLAEVARKQNEAYVNAHEMPVRRQLCLFKLRRSRSCTICQQAASFQLPCGHVVHRACVFRWAKGQGATSCPVCARHLYLNAYELYFKERAVPAIPHARELTRGWVQEPWRILPPALRQRRGPGVRVVPVGGAADAGLVLGHFPIHQGTTNVDPRGFEAGMA